MKTKKAKTAKVNYVETKGKYSVYSCPSCKTEYQGSKINYKTIRYKCDCGQELILNHSPFIYPDYKLIETSLTLYVDEIKIIDAYINNMCGDDTLSIICRDMEVPMVLAYLTGYKNFTIINQKDDIVYLHREFDNIMVKNFSKDMTVSFSNDELIFTV